MTEDFSAKKIYGLIGYPVKHSLSARMHNAAFQALNINAEYKLFELKPEDLEGFLLNNIEVKDTKGESFFSQDIIGFNITIPHKVRAFEIVLPGGISLVKNITTRQDRYVFLSGAINTVKRDKDRLCYYNTDASGFLKSLEKDLKFKAKDKKILIFGCGGAGRAVIAALTCQDADIKKIYIYDTSKEAIDSAREHFSRFDFVKDKLEFISLKQIAEMIKDCALLVNTSPVGMKEGDGSVVDKSLLHKDLSVYDVVYNKQAQLIKDAKSLGLPAMNGEGMLLYQGVEAFELWTGQEAPVEVMRKPLTEAIGK